MWRSSHPHHERLGIDGVVHLRAEEDDEEHDCRVRAVAGRGGHEQHVLLVHLPHPHRDAGLYWNYTAEVIAILLAELCVFVVATQFKVHTMKTGLPWLAIYPATILVVWMLETLAGIS